MRRNEAIFGCRGRTKFSKTSRSWVLGTAIPYSLSKALKYFSAVCWQ